MIANVKIYLGGEFVSDADISIDTVVSAEELQGLRTLEIDSLVGAGCWDRIEITTVS